MQCVTGGIGYVNDFRGGEINHHHDVWADLIQMTSGQDIIIKTHIYSS